MQKRTFAGLILVLTALLLLAACQRAASQAPLSSSATPTGPLVTVETPTGMGQVQMLGTTQMILTMTAVATNPLVLLPTTTPISGEGTPGVFTLQAPTSPATTPVVIVPSSTPGHPASYTLMTGEYPYCIARRFNVDQNELMTLNGLSNSTLLQPGKSLFIPSTGNPFVGKRNLQIHPASYTVSSSEDTIYKVACYFGDVDPAQIIAANGLTSPYTLHLNQVLNIP